MTAEVRRAKKTFNIVATSLIDSLIAIFGQETKLVFLKEEMERMSKDPKDMHVPAANFFKTMNIVTAIRSETDPDRVIVVGELIARTDERLFTPETKVSIPALEQLDIPAKWPKLNAKNKVKMWELLVRLAALSSQVVIGTQLLDHPEMLEAIKKLQGSEHALQPGASEAQYVEFAKLVENSLLAKTK